MRRTVLPVVRVLLWAVIAVSLAYLAFFRSDPGDPVDSATPTVDLTPAEVPVARGTVENTVQLTGTVVADPAVPVRATATGVVRRLRAQAGAVLAAGDPVVDVTFTFERDPVTAADGTVTTPAPQTRTVTVAAPAAGTLTTLDVLVDQSLTVGEDVGTLSPGTLTVQAPLTQDQQFRLLAPPAAAEVTVPGGPAPFTCSDVRTGIPTGTAQPPPPVDPFAPPQSASTGAAVTCRVPAGVPAFAGLSAQVSLQAGVSTDVLVLPVTAVRGSVGNGVVYRLAEDGTQAEVPVVLGLTDGEQVEVREGLAEGDRVLQFVPGLEDLSGQLGPGEVGFGVGG